MKTEIVELNSDNIDFSIISRAAKIIREGGLVVFPTETVYGLGGDATSNSSSEKIYRAKGRPSDNPLIIHIANPQDADVYTYTNEIYYRLAKRFMPGPLTVILKSKDTVSPETRAHLDTVAVRCPSNSIAHALISASGVAIAAPSANLSGSPSPTCGRHVIDDMNGRVDMIIDGGSSDIGLESTIVKIEEDNTLTLLRPGAITLEDLKQIAEVKVASAVTNQLKDGEKVLSPGMKYKHYAPSAPFVLLDGDSEGRIKYIKCQKGKCAVLCNTEEIEKYKLFLKSDFIFDIGNMGDEYREAKVLFFYLREADKKKPDVIFAPIPPLDGIGMALYNRMIRAAAHKIIKL